MDLSECHDHQIDIQGEVKDCGKRPDQSVLDADSNADTAKHHQREPDGGEVSDDGDRKPRQQAETARNLKTANQGPELRNSVAHVFPPHRVPEKARHPETHEGNCGETNEKGVHWRKHSVFPRSHMREKREVWIFEEVREGGWCRSLQRIDHFEETEFEEIRVRRVDAIHTMLAEDGGDVGIRHEVSTDDDSMGR